MKLIIQVLLILKIFIFFNANAVETGTQDTSNTTIDLGSVLKLNKAFENTKFIMTPGKIAKRIFQENIKKIETECCDQNFPQKEKLMEIKSTLQNCLDTKCEKYGIPIYNTKNPPKKLVSFRYIKLIDDLLLENEKFKYEQLSKKFSTNRSERLKDEKNIVVLKENIEDLEKENISLKKTVDKMLSNYQDKIKKLKEENQILSDNFDVVFKAHSKNKQKNLEKDLK